MATSPVILTLEFLRRLERMELQARRVLGGQMKGERRSRHKGLGTDFADYRQYSRGDDLRHLDWNVYGRLDRLFIKIFHEEQDLRCHLLLDTSKSMDFGEPNKLTFAKQLAAAIAYAGLTSNDRITMSCFDATRGKSFGPARGRHQARRLFATLDGLEGDGITSLATICRQSSLTTRAKAVVVLVSDFMDPAGYEEALRFLARESFDVYLLHVLSPQELEPDETGHLSLVDSETGHTVEVTLNPRMKRMYKKTLDAYVTGLKDFALKRGMYYAIARSDSKVEDFVLKQLRGAGMLKL